MTSRYETYPYNAIILLAGLFLAHVFVVLCRYYWLVNSYASILFPGLPSCAVAVKDCRGRFHVDQLCTNYANLKAEQASLNLHNDVCQQTRPYGTLWIRNDWVHRKLHHILAYSCLGCRRIPVTDAWCFVTVRILSKNVVSWFWRPTFDVHRPTPSAVLIGHYNPYMCQYLKVLSCIHHWCTTHLWLAQPTVAPISIGQNRLWPVFSIMVSVSDSSPASTLQVVWDIIGRWRVRCGCFCLGHEFLGVIYDATGHDVKHVLDEIHQPSPLTTDWEASKRFVAWFRSSS